MALEEDLISLFDRYSCIDPKGLAKMVMKKVLLNARDNRIYNMRAKMTEKEVCSATGLGSTRIKCIVKKQMELRRK